MPPVPEFWPGVSWGAKDEEGASRTVTTIIGLSVVLGILLCVGGIVFMEPIMRAFGAKDEDRFHESVRFALKGALVLTVLAFNLVGDALRDALDPKLKNL